MQVEKNSRDFVFELISRTYESHESMLKMCLKYMSTDDVADMLEDNECLHGFYESYLEEFGIRNVK
tara:strand:+ start:899 stop:1096 length:198 start_codon:yes stop_codon:yes gene_type:complete